MEKKLTKQEIWHLKKESIIKTIKNSKVEKASKEILTDYLEMACLYKINAYGQSFQFFKMANLLVNCEKAEKPIIKKIIKKILVEFKIIKKRELVIKEKERWLQLKKEIEQSQLIIIEEAFTKELLFEKTLDELNQENSDKILLVFGKINEIETSLKNYKHLNDTFKYKIKGNQMNEEGFYQNLNSKLKKQNITISKEIVFQQIKDLDGELSTSKLNQLYSEIVYQAVKQNKNEITLDMFPHYKDGSHKEDLNQLPGLKNIKEKINELEALLKYKKALKKQGGTFPLNMIFSGNPGTGKTMVARMCAEIFYELGYIKKNKIIEVTPNDLIGQYVGWTAEKTREILASAKDGVLFIDEAYLLYEKGEKSNTFINQAIIELMKYMENNRNVVIMAGYKEDMEKVIKANAGLRSRILYQIDFNDYNVEELVEIFKYHAQKENIKITNSLENQLQEIIKKEMKKTHFGNGRFIEKLLNDLIVLHAHNYQKTNTIKFNVDILKDYQKKYQTMQTETPKFGFLGGNYEKTN